MSTIPPNDGEPRPSSPPPPYYGSPTPPPYGYPPSQPYGAPPISPADERTWALLAHLSGFLSIIATIVIWAVFKDRGPFIRDQATEALNFQITVTIAGFAVAIISVVTLGLGAILYLAFVVAIVFQIMGAVAANRGEAYRYPLNWRLVH